MSDAPALRPYQRECLTRIRAAYAAGKRRLLVSLPTGTGKTVVFASLPRFFGMKRRMLVLAHRQELLDQAAAKCRVLAPDMPVGVEQAGRRAGDDARIVLASVPTLGREGGARIERFDPEDYYLVIVDEAHHAVAPSYRRIFERFQLFAPDSRRLLVGFTATPRRGDKRGLGDIFEHVVFERSLPDMVREGWLAPIRGYRVTSNIALDKVRIRHGDFVESDLGRAVNVAERNALVVASYAKLARGRRALVFAVDVAHARALAAELAAAGVRARPVWGAMDPSERQAALAAFARGELDVLTNCNVLTEGFDEPRIDCILLARPTKSQVLYAQMVGRATRLHPDKSDALVVDMVDLAGQHRLASMADLFGLPATLDLGGANAIQVRDSLRRIAVEMPWIDVERVRHASELPLVAERFDLFRFEPPPEIAPVTAFAWCRDPEGGYRLTLLDGESAAVRPDRLGRWEVHLYARDAPRLPPHVADLATAIHCVDRAIMQSRPDAARVVAVDAGWRDLPATDKQLGRLAAHRIPHPQGLTRGQASWMIAMRGR